MPILPLAESFLNVLRHLHLSLFYYKLPELITLKVAGPLIR